MKKIYQSSEVASRIKKMAILKSISIDSMLKGSGIGHSTLNNMKTSWPHADSIAKIADYLDVSADYLLGRTDSLGISDLSELFLTEKDFLTISAYKKADKNIQKAIDILLGMAE